MKKNKKIFALAIVLSMLFSMCSLGNTWKWETVQGNHNRSILLDKTHESSKDIFNRYTRGEIFSTAMSEITNERNGKIHINIDTFAHNSVDEIHHTVFLDQWDDAEQDWVQVGYWAFSKTRGETEDGKLISLSTGFTVDGYPVNKYYRVRGLHLVKLNGSTEGGATQTNGVLITKN